MFNFEAETPFFEYTANEIIELIFSWLDENSLLILLETCKKFSDILHNDVFLKNLETSVPNFAKKMALENQKRLFREKQITLIQDAKNLIEAIYINNPEFKEFIKIETSTREFGVKEQLELNMAWLKEEGQTLRLIGEKLKQTVADLTKKEKISYKDLREFKKQLEIYTLANVTTYTNQFKFDKFILSAFLILALFGVLQYFGITNLTAASQRSDVESAKTNASPAYVSWAQECDKTNPDYQNCEQHYNAWNAAETEWLYWFLGEFFGSAGIAAVFVALGCVAWNKFEKQQDAAAKASVTNLDDISKFSAWAKVKENYAEFLKDKQINSIEEMKNFVDKFLTADSPLAFLKQEGAVLLEMLDGMMSAIKKQVKQKKYSPYFTQKRSKVEFYSKSDSFFKKVDEILKDKNSRVVEIKDAVNDKVVNGKQEERVIARSPLLS